MPDYLDPDPEPDYIIKKRAEPKEMRFMSEGNIKKDEPVVAVPLEWFETIEKRISELEKSKDNVLKFMEATINLTKQHTNEIAELKSWKSKFCFNTSDDFTLSSILLEIIEFRKEINELKERMEALEQPDISTEDIERLKATTERIRKLTSGEKEFGIPDEKNLTSKEIAKTFEEDEMRQEEIILSRKEFDGLIYLALNSNLGNGEWVDALDKKWMVRQKE